MGGMGFGHVKKSVERIERLTEYHARHARIRRAEEVFRRLKDIEREHASLMKELRELAPELFEEAPAYPPGDDVADVSDYCPNYEPDDFDESTGRGLLPGEIERRFDDFSRWSAQSLDRDIPGYEPPGANEYDGYAHCSDPTDFPH